MIEIYHLIYYREAGNSNQHYQIIRRRSWDFKIKGRRLDRSIYTPFMNHHLIQTLHEYYNKWHYVPSEINNDRILEFTLGIDQETKIQAMAITHPHDNYNKKIGRAIVEGRIKRQRGELDNGTRYKYVPLPNYIYDPSVEDSQ